MSAGRRSLALEFSGSFTILWTLRRVCFQQWRWWWPQRKQQHWQWQWLTTRGQNPTSGLALREAVMDPAWIEGEGRKNPYTLEYWTSWKRGILQLECKFDFWIRRKGQHCGVADIEGSKFLAARAAGKEEQHILGLIISAAAASWPS